MKTVMKKLLSIMLVALLLVSAVPFQANAAEQKPVMLKLVVDGSDTVETTALFGNEGDTIKEEEVKAHAVSVWTSYRGQGLEYIRSDAKYDTSMTYGNATTIYVYMNSVAVEAPETPTEAPEAPAVGNLIIYAMTKTEATSYVDFNYGQAIVLEGSAKAKLDKALAERVIGKQLLDFEWQGATEDANGNVTVNLLATILETKNDKNVYQLRIQYNNGTSDYKQIDIFEGEGILAAIKNAGISLSYADHVLVGYTLNHTGTAATSVNIYHVAEASMANASGVIKVYADWREVTDDSDEDFEYGEGGGLNGDANKDPIYDAVLLIYTNGNTKNHAVKVTANELGAYTKDGKLTRGEVELIVQKNLKVTSTTKYYGLFTTKTWDKGDYDVDYAVSSVELDPKNTTTVYIMVTNSKVIEADPSNPKTGDGIVIALATMMSTGGAALALGKKKFF